MADFWFGNLLAAGYFPAPNTGMDADTIGEDETLSFANGGAYVSQSAGTHREFNLQWGVQEKSVMDFLKDYRNGVYGSGLLYMVDPFAKNALPPHWAKPGLTCDGWPSLVGPSVKPVRAAAGTVTNLFTNPSFETLTGSLGTTLRTNLVPDPGATNILRGVKWEGGGMGATATMTSVSNAIPEMPASKAFRLTYNTASANSVGAVGHNATIPVTGGVAHTFSLYARASNSQSMGIEVKFFDVSGAAVGTVQNGPKTQVPFQTPIRLSATFTPPSTAVFAQLLVVTAAGGVTWAAASWIEATAFLVETRTVVSDYFDGSMGTVGDFTYSWSGSANGSSSIQRGAWPASATSAPAVSSTAWSSTGGRSLRISPISSNDSYVALGGDAGSVRLGLQSGKTYTVLAKVRADTELTGSLRAGSTKVILVHTRAGTSPYVQTFSNIPPNVAGVHDLRVVFTMPAAASEAFIRLYNGAPAGGGDVWFDDVALIEGEYSGPYFDGSTEFVDGSRGAWTGTPNESTSTLARTPGNMPNTGAQYTLAGEVGAVPHRKLRLLVPQDRDLWFGFSGMATNGAVIQMRGITSGGSYGPTTVVPLLDPSGSTRLNTKVSGGQYSAVEVYLTTSLPGAATITLVSGKAIYVEANSNPTLTGGHTEGAGHTGFRIGDVSTAYIQAADGHEYVTTAVKGTEIEAWL